MNNSAAASPSGTPRVERTVAFALAAMGLEVVQRSTLRALLPRGTTRLRGPANRERWHLGEDIKAYKNKTSAAFCDALRTLEGRGWLERTPEVVIVHDRRALLSYAQSRQPRVTLQHLNIKGALTVVRNDLRDLRASGQRAQLERRHEEIKILLALLHAPSMQCCAV